MREEPFEGYQYWLEHHTDTREQEKKVREVRAEIFRLAKNSPTMHIMHWYTQLDECFENDELQLDELGNLRWRATVLSWEKEPVSRLLWLIDDCVKAHKLDLCEV